MAVNWHKSKVLGLDGDETLLDGPRRALLCSRTPKAPRPATPWVRATTEAVERLARDGEILVTGVGRTPYDLALFACTQAGGAAIVVLETPPPGGLPPEYGTILPERCLLLWPKEPLQGPDARRFGLARRDGFIGGLATCATAIALRKGGNMAGMAAALRARGAPIDETRLVKIARESSRTESIPPILERPGAWEYLTHFTRACEGAWPGETLRGYLAWLADGPQDATREALDTLRRICAMCRVIGSARLMPARVPMASFSAKPPWALAGRMTWRRGLARWTFRPYGVAARRAALERLGARAVAYCSPDESKALPPDERLYAQRHQPPETDWSPEAEWRLRGDLDLSALAPDDWLALVPSEAEAAALRAEGVEARALCE